MRTSRVNPAIATGDEALVFPLTHRHVPALKIVAGCAIIVLGAQVRIPLPPSPVPMTLQLMGVLFVGLTLAPTQAVSAAVLYLLCGAAGLPVFAAGSAGVFGPTGGYLVGFVASAWLVSYMRGRSEVGLGRLLLAATCGTVVVFVLGVGWLAVWPGEVGLSLKTGFFPFALKAALQVPLVAVLVFQIHRIRNPR
ncbi:MAG: biotin transporter BioY [Planctomycetes bacterium]|nr:biotin transporter BioY [Planctomycetota bacterium]